MCITHSTQCCNITIFIRISYKHHWDWWKIATNLNILGAQKARVNTSFSKRGISTLVILQKPKDCFLIPWWKKFWIQGKHQDWRMLWRHDYGISSLHMHRDSTLQLLRWRWSHVSRIRPAIDSQEMFNLMNIATESVDVGLQMLILNAILTC